MRTNLLAWLSLALGVLAPVTCGATGPFAIILGIVALRRVNLSDGALPGGRAARAGIVLGGAGIVLFFLGFLTVGIYRLRGQSQLTVCTDNLRRIGLAVNLYQNDGDHPRYPPGTVIVPDLPPDQRLSWMVAILPYMEAVPVADTAPPAAFQKGAGLAGRFDLTRGWQAEQNRQAMTGSLPWYICPAASYRPAPGEPSLTQYVGIAGYGADAPVLAKTDPRAGFFGYDRIITREDVKRGTAETIMVTERADAVGPWAQGGPATVTGVDADRQPFVRGQFGGLHPHLANTLFADAHVRQIMDNANPRVWEDQCRINVDQ
jgi:prepilin-type processing-associated H-X9-DG protein